MLSQTKSYHLANTNSFLQQPYFIQLPAQFCTSIATRDSTAACEEMTHNHIGNTHLEMLNA